MLKKLLGTSGTRMLNALTGFLTLWLATNELGREAWGIAAFVVVDAAFILLISDLMAGSVLIYFAPRKSVRTLLKIAYPSIAIVIFCSFLFFEGLSFFPNVYTKIIPEGYTFEILALALLNALHFVNLNILLGKEKIFQFNMLFLTQFVTQILSMAFFIYVLDIHDAHAFIYSQFIGFVVPVIPGFCMLIPFLLKEAQKDDLRTTLHEFFKFGLMIQLSSFVSIINRRLSYFVIRKYNDMGSVGVYNSGVQITEGLKLIAQSIAQIQFSSISNSNSKEYAAQLSIKLMKLAVILTTLALSVLALIPQNVFEYVFSREFGDMKLVILTLSPGIICLAANNIFCHYFSGINKPKHNLYASIVGLLVTIPSTLILIPLYGFVGAGISTSLTYFSSVVYQWIVFKKMTSTHFIDLIPNKLDWQILVEASKKLLKSQ